jgi:hypothetical protein
MRYGDAVNPNDRELLLFLAAMVRELLGLPRVNTNQLVQQLDDLVAAVRGEEVKLPARAE